jgi:hypothetical protein
MRRIVVVAATLVAMLAGTASPATAAPGWVPAPTAPFDQAAGVTCDFAVHAEPTVDEVVTKVLQRYPDGSIHRDAYQGPLIIRVTNTETGGSYDADVSGSAIVDHAPDGAQTWYAVGPVLLGVHEGLGNLPRGLWVVGGVYRLEISASGYKKVTLIHGTVDTVCDHI